MHIVVAIYCLSIGILMAIWWTISLRNGALVRADRSRTEMTLRVAAELTTASLLIVSGAALLADGDDAVPSAALALGMLLYTVVVSPGYFITRREPAPAYLFVGLTILTVAAAALLVT